MIKKFNSSGRNDDSKSGAPNNSFKHIMKKNGCKDKVLNSPSYSGSLKNHFK